MIGYLFISNNLHQIYCSAILDRRLKEPGFELMKPHTVKGYNGAENSLQKQKHANITGHAESVASEPTALVGLRHRLCHAALDVGHRSLSD
jgi:hypothetical protein